MKWAFTLERGKALKEKWRKIPEGIDFLVTHGPPLGYLDDLARGGNAGCLDLLYEIKHRIKPKYHVFGHIHEGDCMGGGEGRGMGKGEGGGGGKGGGGRGGGVCRVQDCSLQWNVYVHV